MICGGESGPRARPFDLAWARSLRDQCREADTAYFLKQIGKVAVSSDPDDKRACGNMLLPDGFQWLTQDSHGGDEAEWPEDLRGCRAFPEVRHA